MFRAHRSPGPTDPHTPADPADVIADEGDSSCCTSAVNPVLDTISDALLRGFVCC